MTSFIQRVVGCYAGRATSLHRLANSRPSAGPTCGPIVGWGTKDVCLSREVPITAPQLSAAGQGMDHTSLRLKWRSEVELGSWLGVTAQC